jgi:hypothetical protein
MNAIRNIGILEYWNVGMLEYWINEIIPLFQCSIIPNDCIKVTCRMKLTFHLIKKFLSD